MNKIVIPVSTLRPITGGVKYINEVISGLKDKGHNVIVVNYEDAPAIVKATPFIINILLSNIWFWHKIKNRINVGEILLEDYHLHPRLILTNLWVKSMPKIIIAVLLQSGLYYHKSLNNKLTKYFDHIHVKSLFKQAEIIFANSNSTKNEVLSLGIPATKIAMISCGHDPLPTVKRKQKTKKSIQLLYVGRVSRNRGLDYLMHALGKLTDYNWQLLVVGDEKDNPEFVGSLSTLAIQYNIANRVEFYGFTKDRHELAALYNQADIFVLPSLVEGFGIVLLEAMSAGLAIVATTAGAIPELIKNNKTGLLVPPGDIDHLTNTIEKAMKDETLRKNIGQNAKYIYEQEFRTKYTWEIVIANINNVLTSP